MYGRMIARDFTRNRSVSVVLVVLMMLSVVLATASAGTLVRLVGSSQNLMARADAPDVVQLHAGEYDPHEVDRWVAGRPEVAHDQAMLMLGIDGANLFFDGVPQTTNIQQNSLVVPNQERDLLLDLDNQPITEVEPGTIVLPVIYEVEATLAVGDPVTITADGFTKELTIAGFARDSIMNPALASSKRLVVAPGDLEEVRAHTGVVEHLVEFWMHDPGADTASFAKAYQDAGMPQAGQMVDSAGFQMITMIGDGMVAAVVILVAFLLLVVALLCLRFSVLTATEQDHREIGVLRAIGVAPRDVQRIYLTKYAVLAAIASVLGVLGGLALTPLLTRNITRYMGSVGSVWNWVVPLLTAASVFAALMLFVLVLVRRFNRVSALTAIGVGTSGGRSAAVRLRLHGSRMPVNFRLGVMNVLDRWPAYLVLLFVFVVSTFITIVPISSATTANAPGFIQYMGTGPVDLRIDLRNIDDASTAQFSRMVDQLGADPDAAAISPMVTTRNDTVDKDGNTVSLYVENGDHTRFPLTYADGRAPTVESEIALSLLALSQTGWSVGDAVSIEAGGRFRDLRIVGSYQDVTNGGKTAKAVLPTDGDEVMWYVVGVGLAQGVDIAGKAAAYSDQLAPARVADIEQWRIQTLGPIAGRLTVTAVGSALVAIALSVLMTALFTRMLLARDAGQVAIQRAVGADDGGLRRQYLTRLLLVLVLGVVVGTVAAMTLGESLFNLMFEGLFGGFESLGSGTSQIDFAVHPLLAYLALPAALLSAVALATVAASRAISAAAISTLTTE
ncbi:FtsX-like permease family protein [Pseudonocardia parietis]|uniref:ABC transport system permease protein n=1 Tax=Pseudonocardia parietis TaxID=570936 RepID=A0ABS4VWX9_9PSEU|nr:ABC transporter permease [Pseudonocardia parietis]MBP2368421.1 putative ABC transport system permease protein [Pseudonocardia parietis]